MALIYNSRIYSTFASIAPTLWFVQTRYCRHLHLGIDQSRSLQDGSCNHHRGNSINFLFKYLWEIINVFLMISLKMINMLWVVYKRNTVGNIFIKLSFCGRWQTTCSRNPATVSEWILLPSTCRGPENTDYPDTTATENTADCPRSGTGRTWEGSYPTAQSTNTSICTSEYFINTNNKLEQQHNNAVY